MSYNSNFEQKKSEEDDIDIIKRIAEALTTKILDSNGVFDCNSLETWITEIITDIEEMKLEH